MSMSTRNRAARGSHGVRARFEFVRSMHNVLRMRNLLRLAICHEDRSRPLLQPHQTSVSR